MSEPHDGLQTDDHAAWFRPTPEETLSSGKMNERTCKWKRSTYHGDYKASCGNVFGFQDGDFLGEHPTFKFCPYCGREIKVTNE